MTAEAAGTGRTCIVCHHGTPGQPVCDRCQRRTGEQLAALPALRNRLRLALVPGPGSGGERVSAVRGEAPMPARLAALTLAAGGSDEARCVFVPAVRVWTTVEAVPDAPVPDELVPAGSGGGPVRPALRWHRELVRDSQGRPVMALADDQAGVLPVEAWLRCWAQDWRRALGHRISLPPRRRDPSPAAPPRRMTAELLGIARMQPPADRPADPVEQEWDQRWPADANGWGPVTAAHHAYLTRSLSLAAEEVSSFVDFAASLRTLTGALRAALCDVDDLEYVGRCPEEINGEACGAPIWHDVYASVITCPRCHTETSQDGRVWLARRILDAWPIDRRRRYPRGLIDALRQPRCRTCTGALTVQWIDATEQADRERFWRPGALSCSAGCEVVE